MKEKRILLLGATFGTENMGVSALTAGSIEACLHTWPDAKILLLDYEKTPVVFQFNSTNRPVPVELLNMRFSKRLYLRNNIAILIILAAVLRLVPSRLRRSITMRNRYLNEIDWAYLVVSLSGGDSFSDIYGLQRFFYSYLPMLLVQVTGKRIVFLPQTLGPFNGWVARVLARFILKNAALVYSRDLVGLDEMREFLGNHFDPELFRFCYDVGFVVSPVRPEKMDLSGFEDRRPHSPTVGLNVSGLLWMGGYKQNNQFGLKADYRLLVERLIHHLIHEKNMSVLLIPHVFGDVRSPESDQVACETLHRALQVKYGDRLNLARGRYDQSEIKYIIGLCDFFIGSRMHACIAALSQNIPTVPVAYSKKFIGVMETIGVDSYVADARTMDEGEILSIADRAWAEKDKIRRHLEGKIPEVKARILRIYEEAAATLGMEK